MATFFVTLTLLSAVILLTNHYSTEDPCSFGLPNRRVKAESASPSLSEKVVDQLLSTLSQGDRASLLFSTTATKLCGQLVTKREYEEKAEWITCMLANKLLVPTLVHPSSSSSSPSSSSSSSTEETVPTFFIASNRRSGTHLAMEMLLNSFRGPMRVVKTNHVMADRRVGCECIAWMQSLGGIIHAYRDVKDVLVSTYHYRKGWDRFLRNRTFSEFLLANGSDIINEWRLTTYGWQQQPGVMEVRFSDNIDDTRRLTYVLPALSSAFNLTLNERRRLPRENWDISSNAVGKFLGDGDEGWQRMFSEEQLDWLGRILRTPLNTSSLLVGENACPPSIGWAKEGIERIPSNVGGVSKFLRKMRAPLGCAWMERKGKALTIQVDKFGMTVDTNGRS